MRGRLTPSHYYTLRYHSKSGHKGSDFFAHHYHTGCLAIDWALLLQTTLSLFPEAKTALRQMGQVEFSESQRSMQCTWYSCEHGSLRSLLPSVYSVMHTLQVFRASLSPKFLMARLSICSLVSPLGWSSSSSLSRKNCARLRNGREPLSSKVTGPLVFRPSRLAPDVELASCPPSYPSPELTSAFSLPEAPPPCGSKASTFWLGAGPLGSASVSLYMK